ncbi:hypothetical protein MARPU_05685 [Marichromatium purpuratum 984]|uniref:Uncharacterized protein n=1 Tax=Marichromatium purpuratum 984 TaxID=765910 RepID=W0E3S7_MARPU|nr:hypothetical protein [Marichromatium purpuratum]AHF05412.1 hypothetical protein MARPU_05685 [Marichromatium purpuratum 984]
MSRDVLHETADELIAAGADPTLVRGVIARIRQRVGGAEVYVCAIDRVARDDAIRRELAAGRDIHEAARRIGVSPSTIRRRRSQWLR